MSLSSKCLRTSTLFHASHQLTVYTLGLCTHSIILLVTFPVLPPGAGGFDQCVSCVADSTLVVLCGGCPIIHPLLTDIDGCL